MRKIKKHIQITSLLTLVITIISLWQISGFFKNITPAEAAIKPNENPIIQYTLPNGSETSSIRSEMDKEGNQYITWQTTEDATCDHIYLQVFNKSGIPITQANSIAETCIANNKFYTPDLTINDNYIVITYTKKVNTTYSTEMVVYNKNTYAIAKTAQQIDSGLILDENARPRVSSNQAGDEIGVVFQACDNSSCTDHEVYFQGFNNLFNPAHGSNILINASTTGNQFDSNISYSGSHFLITFTETGVTTNTTVQASAINYLGDNKSAEINIDSNLSESADVAGTSDVDLTATPSIESFYITYRHEFPDTTSEIRMKKVYCEYDSSTPLTYSCNKTSRDGETVYVRVSTPNSTAWKGKPQLSVYKNNTDLKKVPPYENTNIDQISVAWEEAISSNTYVHIQNYTNTLSKSGNIIIEDEPLTGSDTLSIGSNQDGHYMVTYNAANTNHVKVYPTQLLKRSNERLVNPPDSNAQKNPDVDKNSNGDYVITYQHFNGTDYDIVYAMYDKYENPILNTHIANTYTSGDQINPKVAFWNEDKASPNYGKFIIAWEGEGNKNGGGTTSNGIYAQIFNADGSKSNSEIIAHENDSSEYSNSEVDLATGKFKQYIIIYKEYNSLLTSDQNKVKLKYYNASNSWNYTLDAFTGRVAGSNVNAKPLIALSPEANPTDLGATSTSKFAAMWNDDTNSYKSEGYLSASGPVISSGPTTISNTLYEDLDGGYNSTLSTLTPALDPFYYAGTLHNNVSENEELKVMFYGSTYVNNYTLETDSDSKVSIDPGSQNIFTIGQKYANYNDYIDKNQVILIASDATNNINNGPLTNEDFTASATVSETGTYHAFIKNVTGTFAAGERVGTTTGYTSTSVANTTVLNFATDISSHFTINQTVNDPSNSAQGDIVAISNYYIVLENVTGTFAGGGGTLNNSPYNDSYTSTETGTNIYFAPNEGSNFETDNYVENSTASGKGLIKHIENTFITVINITGSFSATESILDFNSSATIIYDPIEYIGGRYYHFNIDSNQPIWTAAGPTFSVNESSYYGQSFNSSAAAYDTRASDNTGKFTATVYSNNSSPDYLDENGVFQQILEDAFTIGQKEDLAPHTEQEVEPGGKYIVVPQTIDFGNISRNTTGSVDFATLTPSCLTVTDLDGTDFDLTVSLTNLENIDNPPDTISNSNVIIENNNGSNPNVVSLVNFSDPEDVVLSSSTNPGQDANLSTTQTLLTKSKPYTGSWKICPKTKLTIPADASSGHYTGTLTFTLI